MTPPCATFTSANPTSSLAVLAIRSMRARSYSSTESSFRFGGFSPYDIHRSAFQSPSSQAGGIITAAVLVRLASIPRTYGTTEWTEPGFRPVTRLGFGPSLHCSSRGRRLTLSRLDQRIVVGRRQPLPSDRVPERAGDRVVRRLPRRVATDPVLAPTSVGLGGRVEDVDHRERLVVGHGRVIELAVPVFVDQLRPHVANVFRCPVLLEQHPPDLDVLLVPDPLHRDRLLDVLALHLDAVQAVDGPTVAVLERRSIRAVQTRRFDGLVPPHSRRALRDDDEALERPPPIAGPSDIGPEIEI